MKTIKYLVLLLIVFSSQLSFAQKKKRHADTSAYKYAIPWEPIRAADMLWKKRVWREIEVYQRSNRAFRDNAGTPAENLFGNVLLSGIRAGVFKAYRDTFFTSPLTIDEVNTVIQCNPGELSWRSRLYVNHRNNHPGDTTDALSTTKSSNDTAKVESCIFPQQVERYEITEDWIFDRNKGLMVVHIAAIAPIAIVEGKPQKLFWVKYPEIRAYMAKYEVYTGDTATYRSTWDEYFESRQFSSRITYVSGGIKGEVITEKKEKKSRKQKRHKEVSEEIFNKDTNTWVY